MKTFVYIGAALVALLFSTGCAFKSPTEWQVAVGTILFSAIQEGTLELAVRKLEQFHRDGVIDDATFEEYKKRVLECESR
jgi:hypothetical protein